MSTSTGEWSEAKETGKQVRRFLVIGFSSVAVDLTVYALLAWLGVLVHVAKGISYVAGMVLGFIGNKLWTFESQRKSIAEPITYVILYTATLLVNVTVNGVALWLLDGFLLYRYAKWSAFLAATGVTTVLNFLGMRIITFRAGIDDRRRRELGGADDPTAAGRP